MSTLLQKAKEAMKKKNFDYTIDLCLQELRMKPDNVEARTLLREAERERVGRDGGKASKAGALFKGFGSVLGAKFGGLTKNYDKVMMACEEYLKNAPNDVGYLFKLGEAAHKAGYLDTAIAVHKDILTIDKKHVGALRSLAQIYKDLDDIETSAKYYEALRKADPSDKEANKAVRQLAAMASSRKMDEAKEKGEGDYRSLIKDKDQAASLEKEQRILRSDDEILEAIGECQTQLKAEPKNYKIYSRMGELYSRIRKYEEAVAAYHKAYELHDSDGTILNTIGDLKVKDLTEQLRVVEAKLKKGKDDKLEAQRKKLNQEKNDFCIAEWTRRVEAYPTEHGYKYDLGRFLFTGGRIDEAISNLQKAMDDPRNRRKAHNMLGQCFMKKKVYDLALKEFGKGLDSLPTSDKLYKELTYNQARTYELMGDTENARISYEKIMEVDYNYKDVAKKVTSLQQS